MCIWVEGVGGSCLNSGENLFPIQLSLHQIFIPVFLVENMALSTGCKISLRSFCFWRILLMRLSNIPSPSPSLQRFTGQSQKSRFCYNRINLSACFRRKTGRSLLNSKLQISLIPHCCEKYKQLLGENRSPSYFLVKKKFLSSLLAEAWLGFPLVSAQGWLSCSPILLPLVVDERFVPPKKASAAFPVNSM